MHGPLRIAIAVLLIVVGALLAWPQMRGWVLLQRAPARILDVVATPVSAGRMRVSVAYEFPLPSRDPAINAMAIAWRAGDASFRPVADPVVSTVRASEIIADLLGPDGRRVRTVFYEATDPEGTVILADGAASGPRTRLQIGAVLVAIAVVLLFLRQRSAPW